VARDALRKRAPIARKLPCRRMASRFAHRRVPQALTMAAIAMSSSALPRGNAGRFVSAARPRKAYWIVLLLAGAVLLGTAVQSYRAIDRELTAAALSRRAAVAQLAAATLAEKFSHLVNVTVSLATRVQFRALVADGKWIEANEILRGVPGDFPFVERLFLTDVEGTLRADVPELPGVRGVNFSHREWYQGVRRAWHPYVSPAYQRAAVPRIDVFAVAAPIRAPGGAVAGILILQVRLDRFFEWARMIEIGPGGFVYFVDSQGRAAFHSKFEASKGILDYSALSVVQKVLRGDQGVEIAYDPFERETVVFAYAPIAEYRWGVVAQQPTRTAFAAKEQPLRLLLIAYGLTAMFAVLAIFLGTRIVLERRRGDEGRRQRAELERRVKERTAQLEATNKELESFTYSVSHDLRAPLRAIDGFARILEDDHGDQLDHEARRLLGVVRDSSRKMGQLIDDLLAFSRLGRKPLQAALIDMKRLAEKALEEARGAAERPPVQATVGALPPAQGDASLVQQVWANLISNAMKFSSGRDEPVIEISGRSDGDYNVYCVKDNGAGFDMRYYDKLFGVFQRLHDPAEFPGTGVGLAIVQRVVAKHGGRAWAESKPGEGAVFYFTLPAGEIA
jgi:signal transduction histidine kinase